jgi:hypothetical protein
LDPESEAELETIEAGGSPQIPVEWNQLLQDIAFAEDQFLTFKGVRCFAMMHIAQHDAINAILGDYDPYIFDGNDSSANTSAAAAQAAHDVMASQYTAGDQLAQIDSLLADQLAAVPDGAAKTAGIALGSQAADAILADRQGDGFDLEGSYQFVSGPGKYQTTPPFNGFVVQPGFRFARPFALTSPSQYRPPPPPSLTSPSYKAAFLEVKSKGELNSTTRTQTQTDIAIWWMEFTDGSMNRLARQLIGDEGLDLTRATRMLAYLNMSMFDGYVAVWDSKYHHNHWRPYTAIRQADTDGNPLTTPDPDWEPLRTTPPHPEYASAHSTVCSSSLEVFKRTFGDSTTFTMSTNTAPPGMPTRTFNRFTTAAAECATSRVLLGWHFRYATDAGKTLGRRVAQRAMDRFLDD